MTKLRPYQQQAIVDINAAFKDHKRVVFQLCTGGGKTYIFSTIAAKAHAKGTKTLILTHRTEILKQILSSSFVPCSGIDNLGEHSVNVCMVETFNRRKKKISFVPDFIIIDESHIANFNKVIDHFPDAYVLGVTATPIGKHFFKYYSKMVEGPDVTELIDQDYLVNYRSYAMVEDTSSLVIKAGEYTSASQYAMFAKQKKYEGVIEKYQQLSSSCTSTLVFNCNIEHSDQMAAQFRASGIESYSITSHTPIDERVDILRRFEAGEFPVLNNCSILTTGYDNPKIDCIILNRATKSLALYLQALGRGSRPSKGKDRCVLLDFGSNIIEHGLFDFGRDWDIKEKRKGTTEPPVKVCPNCLEAVPAITRVCECGFEFNLKDASLYQGEMVDVTKMLSTNTDLVGRSVGSMGVEDLVFLYRVNKIKFSYVCRVVRTRGESDLQEFANIMGYGWGWIQRQKKMSIGFADTKIK